MEIKDYFKNSGLWALVLGGSSGMGLATAKTLAAQGMNLVIVHRDPRQRLSELEAEWESLRSHGIQLITYNENALDPASIAKIIAEIKEKTGEGKLYACIHSIAWGNLKPLCAAGDAPLLESGDFGFTLHAMGYNLWDWVLTLYRTGLLAPEARVLAFTSEGNKRMLPGYAAVGAAKAVLETLVKYMAVEFPPGTVRANIIQAGITDTPALQKISGADRMLERATRRNPSGRITQAEDIARVVLLLLTKEAGWINGAVICADGGESLV